MKGISPIVSIVLLIALAVIISIGIYFWVAGYDFSPSKSAELVEISVTPVGGSNYLVTNTGTKSIILTYLNTTSGNTCEFNSTVTIEPGTSKQCTLNGVPACEELFYGQGTTTATVILGSGCN